MGCCYYSGSLAYFISWCWTFPALYLCPSAVEARHRCCSGKMTARAHTRVRVHTHTHTLTHCKHWDNICSSLTEMCVQPSVGVWAANWIMHLNERHARAHSLLVTSLYTICHVTKAASDSVTLCYRNSNRSNKCFFIKHSNVSRKMTPKISSIKYGTMFLTKSPAWHTCTCDDVSCVRAGV